MPAINDIINGKMGQWQTINFFGSNLVIIAFALPAILMPFFAPYDQAHWCTPASEGEDAPELFNSTLSLRNLSDPVVSQEKCQVLFTYTQNSSNLTDSLVQDNCSSWEYDTGVWERTIVQDYNLVCDRAYLLGISSSVHMSGAFFGVFIVSSLCDRFGRKPILLLTCSIWFLSYFALAFAPSIIVFTVLRFIIGFFSVAAMNTSVIITDESLTDRRRAIWGNLLFVGFPIGILLYNLIAYFVRDWFKVQLITSIPTGLLILVYIYLPESPIWLISVKRFEEAKVCIKRVAKMNGLAIPTDETLEKDFKMTQKESEAAKPIAKANLLDLFKSPELRIITFITMIMWFVVSFSYYGLLFNSGSLYGGVFINMTISSVLEIIGSFLATIVMLKCGRRNSEVGLMIFAGIVALISLAIPKADSDYSWVRTIMILLSRTAVFMNFLIIMTHAAEYYPTVLRSAGVGLASAFARLGGMLSPFVVSLESTTGPSVSLIIYGMLCTFVGIIAFRLPETKNHILQESVIDAEVYWRENRSYKIQWKKKEAEVQEYNMSSNLPKQ